MRIQSNRVCFTLNNYCESEQEALTAWIDNDESPIEYCIVGEEVSSSNTPHLQGFIHLTGGRAEARKRGLRFWKTIPGLARAHFEPARGTDNDSKTYCSKEGPYSERGDPTKEERGDYASVVEDLHKGAQLIDIVDKYPEISIQHFGNIRAIRSILPDDVLFSVPENLRAWQQVVIDNLERQSERKILFVVDRKGGMGKSTLTKYLIKERKAWACTGGKAADLMHAYTPGATIAVFDMARCTCSDYWPWQFIENLKNGWFTTTKYHSRMITFKPPSVVVFCNDDIPRDKLSADRYQVMFISGEPL